MMKTVTTISIFSVLSWLGSFAFAQGLIQPKSQLIIPGFNEVTQFRPEFCGRPLVAQNQTSDQQPQQICFGHMKLQGKLAVRALVITTSQGTKLIYLENGLPGVELLHLGFNVLGPVNTGKTISATIGQAQLSVDDQGEVNAIKVDIAPFGMLEAVQDQAQ